MKDITLICGKPFRAKVFRYSYTKFTEVVETFMTICNLNDNVYLAEYQRSEYNHRECDQFMFIFKVKDFYLESDIVSRFRIENTPNIVDLANDAAVNFVENVNTLVKELQHIKLLYIRVFEALGLDTKPLWEVCKERQRQQDAKETEAEEQRKRDQLEAERKEKQRLEKVKQDFLDDKYIDVYDFLTLCKNDNINIHIRTKGTFNKNVTEVQMSGSIKYRCPKGKKPNLDGCFEIIAQYRKALLSNQ